MMKSRFIKANDRKLKFSKEMAREPGGLGRKIKGENKKALQTAI
jgi:hypothetical protein